MSEKDFWDLTQFVDPKKHTSASRRNDISAVSISIGQEPKVSRTEKIPQAIPNGDNQENEIEEFSYSSGLIRRMSVKKWNREISRYEMFRYNAKSILGIEPKPVEYVKYVSYMPLFEQLSKSQLSYYVYWKSLVQKGVYPNVESSYIFLFLYEIINLPDYYSPEKGVELFVSLMENYGKTYPYIYRNIGEYLIDWCLLRKVSIPSLPENTLEKVISSVSLPELFFNNGEVPKGLLYKFSLYDYKNNKVYKSYEDKEKWDELVSEGVQIGLKEIMASEDIVNKLTYSHMVRDCFQSAPVSSCSKYWISLEYISLTRNVTLKQLIGHCFKVAENEVRDILGVRNSIKNPDLPENISKAIKDYYAENYPYRQSKKSYESEDDQAYMSMYEPVNKEADVQTAEKIEEDAWDTAVKLGAESEEDIYETDIVIDSPVYYTEDSFSDLVKSLDDNELNALKAATQGLFNKYCRDNKILAMELERIINEKAMEYTGDILLESGDIIEDYLDNLTKSLKEGN